MPRKKDRRPVDGEVFSLDIPFYRTCPVRAFTRTCRHCCYTYGVTTMGSVLQLVPAMRIGVKYPGGAYKSERHFLDFVIDGESLWEKVGRPRDTVSVICFEYPREEIVKAVNRLLLTEKAVIPCDRRSLFICSECGDIGCGAVTAFAIREGQSVVWKDFGFENDYEENIRLDEYKDIGPFTFDWKEYESTLLQAIDNLKQPQQSR